jgi:hypothetical protein
MIKKIGNKFRVVSEKTGRNLGEASTKEGAKKRLREVEYFKHAKCIVDPSLVKDQKYQPIVFQTKDRALGNKPEKDFPSTPQAYDLKDVKQPEFVSTPFSGEPYAQSFHNPQAGQGNDPDIQHKGSDFAPSHSTVIGQFASVQPADSGQEPNSTGRGGSADPLIVSRAAITPALDQNIAGEKHISPIKRDNKGPKSIKQVALANTAIGGQTSDFSRSFKIAGKRVLLKNHLNDFKYPTDKGEDHRIFDEETKPTGNVEEDRIRRKELLRQRTRVVREGDYDSYLGRSFKVMFKKGKKIIYTQNQPLDPSLKPIAEEDEEKGGLKIITFNKKHVNKSEFDPGVMKRFVDPEKVKEVKEHKPKPKTAEQYKREHFSETTGKHLEHPKPIYPWNIKNKSDRPNPIKGGIGDSLKKRDVDTNQLIAGTNVELEHIGNNENKTEKEKREISQDIAMDHLAEDKEYYTKLAEMERHQAESKREESKQKKILRAGKTGKVVKMHRVGKSNKITVLPDGSAFFVATISKKRGRNKAEKSIVGIEDFKQRQRNMGKIKIKTRQKEYSDFPRPMGVITAESSKNEKLADVIDIKAKEKQND